jgi:glycosyltransferase involved in cell wall biosynthesis
MSEQIIPRLSIIIPARVGMPYLDFCVQSSLSDGNPLIEVVLVVDSPDSETRQFVDLLEDSRLKKVLHHNNFSMSEHWEFAQSHASGKWQIFLGQDDLLLPDYSQKVFELLDMADSQKTRAIVARRAYVSWPPLGSPSLMGAQYWKTDEIKSISSIAFLRGALRSSISYHAGPQMYTSSVFRSDLIDEIKSKQDGHLIAGHPQDAYLAASALANTKEFLFSGQPFSLVGTSSKSAGLAISSLKKDGKQSNPELAKSYLESVSSSKLGAREIAENFYHGVTSKYFADAVKDLRERGFLEDHNLREIHFRLANIFSLAKYLNNHGSRSDWRNTFETGLGSFAIATIIRIWFRIRSGLVATLSRTFSLVPFVKSPVRSVVKFDSNEELYEFSRSIR